MTSVVVWCFFSSRRRHTRCSRDWSSDVCSSDLIFERILEMPLEKQLEDLRDCLSAMEGGLAAVVSHWRQLEPYRVLLPENAPDYLKELFFSNLRALLEILQDRKSTRLNSSHGYISHA